MLAPMMCPLFAVIALLCEIGMEVLKEPSSSPCSVNACRYDYSVVTSGHVWKADRDLQEVGRNLQYTAL